MTHTLIHPRRVAAAQPPKLGTYGYLAILVWSLAMILLARPERLLHASSLCLLAALVVYPSAFRRIIRPRWLVLLGLFVLINALFLGERDALWLGIQYSTEGFTAGARMALRALVIFIAVDGFSSSVQITEIAGLFERLGLPGLGFSLGVALNILPSLRQASANTWHSLRMRGGLRRRWRRGLQLYFVTLIANALRRAEEIALAAEARAFKPEKSRPMPIRPGSLDLVVFLIGALGTLLMMIW
jgi:energy-coupling factor transporter transmembrane protein EcfT